MQLVLAASGLPHDKASFMSFQIELQDQVEQIRRIYAVSHAVWTGCDWPVEFGIHRLQLQNMTSSQCQLMARATAGREADSWWEAAHWLARIERQAGEARQAAQDALVAVDDQRWAAALTHARVACEIEGRYHTNLIWQPLRDAIAVALKGQS
jgi:hypothetical protein